MIRSVGLLAVAPQSALLALAMLSGCGGATTPNGSENNAPVANSFNVQTEEDTPALVTLSASDADGDALQYTVVTPPSKGQLTGTAPELTYAPNSDFNGTDAFTYTATDGQATSGQATITIDVTAVNDTPVADAGFDLDVTVLNTVTLDGTGSSDPDGPGLTFTWTQTSGPPVVLNDPGAERPSFPAPDQSGPLTFSLLVTDDSSAQSSDVVSVVVHTWVDISAGFEFSLALRSDGTAWGWGDNGSGQLAHDPGSVAEALLPVQIGPGADWTVLSAGSHFVLGIRADGSLWSWGSNTRGELGHGSASFSPTTTPTRVGSATDWVAATAGGFHALARKSDGSLWGWGANDRGQLGAGDFDDRLSPVRIDMAVDWIDVSAGGSHTLALRSDNTLWAWGYNVFGQLGDGTQLERSTPLHVGASSFWVTISAGDEDSGAIRDDGTLWAWGNRVNGLDMIQKGMDSDWTTVTSGGRHTLMLKSNSEAWAWGSNESGQLGDGTTSGIGGLSPPPVQVVSAADWVAVTAGGLRFLVNSHSLGIRSNGSLWAWGTNNRGHLGIGVTDLEAHPEPVLVGEAAPASP